VNLSDVEAAIRSAFADVERDETMTLHQAQVVESALDTPHDEHRRNFEAARLKDRETRWQDIPAASIDECEAALFFLEPGGWRFYLPAFLLRALSLLHASAVDTNIPASVIVSLTISDRSERFSLIRFELLSQAQARAVALFLTFAATDHPNHHARDAQNALNLYWLRFAV
jgi:hypothetical protein